MHGDPRLAATLYHPPLAYHLIGLPLWFVGGPVPAWDPSGPSTQVGLALLYDSAVSPRTVLILARLPILLLGWVGLCLARSLAGRLGGAGAGWIAAFAFALEPNLAAQGVLATTDLAAAVALLALLHVASRAIPVRTAPSVRGAAGLGVAVGLALATKHSLLFPVALVLAYAAWQALRGPVRDTRESLRAAAIVAGVAFLTLWATYGFALDTLAVGDSRPHGNSPRVAELTGLSVDTVDGLLETVPLPAADYVRSLADAVLVKGRERGGSPWTAYLDGEWSSEGYWRYFPLAVWIKTPTALVVLLLVGLGGWRSLRRRDPVAADLLVGSALALFAAAVFSRLNIGVRHVLPATTALLVAGAAVAGARLDLHRRSHAVLLAVAALFLVVDWVPNRTDPLRFASVAAGGPVELGERLSDSNLEMGGDHWRVVEWLRERDTESALLLLHHAPGLYERERAREPLLVRKGAWRRGALLEAVRTTSQDTGEPLERALVLGETQLTRPGHRPFRDVEPYARVGATRVYRLPND